MSKSGFFNDSGSTATTENTIQGSVDAAAASATAAASSETDAQTAQAASEAARDASQTAQTASETAKTASETARNAAQVSQNASATSAAAALVSQNAAASSATSSAADVVSTNADVVSTNADAASTASDRTAAASSASSASTSAATSTTKASESSTSAAASLASQNAAATSAAAALTSQNAAASSQTATAADVVSTNADAASTASDRTASASSASSASTSAATATTKAAEASTSASNAASSLSSFNAVYSTGSSDPTSNLDSGDLFYNSSAGVLKVYTGTAWEQGVTAGSGFLPLTGGQLTGNLTFSGSQTVDGRDVSADGAKLDGIEASATADQTAAEIRTLVENATDSNVFTDADHTKLNAIEASADVTDSTNVANAGAAMLSGATFTGTVTLNNNILASAGTTSLRPAGTEIVTINNTGDITVKGQGSSRAMMLLKAGSNTANSQLRFGDQAADSAGRIMYDHSSNFMRFDTNEAEKMRLTSAGRLGISTSNPLSALHVAGGVDASPAAAGFHAGMSGNYAAIEMAGSDGGFIDFQDATDGNDHAGRIIYAHSDDTMKFSTAGGQRLTITSAGNVGIGTASPDRSLHIAGSEPSVVFENTGQGTDLKTWRIYSNSSSLQVGTVDDAFSAGQNALEITRDNTDNITGIQFKTGASSERMRLDGSSGTLMVGKTSSGTTTAGFETQSSGLTAIVRDSNTPLYVGRNSNDGDIVVLRQGSTTVGVIGTQNWGIGTSSPNEKLTIDSGALSFLGSLSTPSIGAGIFRPANNSLAFVTGSSERARLDASGNLLIGGTEINPQNQSSGSGSALRADGRGFFRATSATVLGANLIGNDGEVIRISKDGSAVGSIGTIGGDMVAGTGDTGLRFHDGADQVYPSNTNGSGRDAAIDLGNNGARFKDGYFSGSVYTTYVKGNGGHTGQVHFTGSHDIRFVTNGNERGRFDQYGNFQVGASTNNYSAQSGFGVNNTGATYTFISHPNGTASGTSYMLFAYNGGAIGSISQNGTTAVSYNTGSDIRLKSNIQDAESASSKIDAIQVRQFDWNADGSHQDYGLIAQELQPIEPLAVTGSADSDEMMGVDYSKLVPMLIKEIQQLRGRVAALEAS